MEPLPVVSPSEEDCRSEEDDEDDEDDDELDESVDLDDEVDEVEVEELSVLELELLPELLALDVVPLLLAAVSASDCTVPTRANTPAAAASVTAAAKAAVRRVPRRTAATAPSSPCRSPGCLRCTLSVMTDPLLRDSLSRITFGYRPERSL
ncbi:hypothetical protein ACFV2H_40295 [Streptomyces sp. NPDC059629]|uniref:hypothetical protein n=1 Tax=Streptomyces sp. NPDC059629 TaxID=3346889 RepID=UPI0036780EAE